jgi:hypothetical protein
MTNRRRGGKQIIRGASASLARYVGVMKAEYKETLDALARRGWNVRPRPTPKPLPEEISARYPWMPADVLEFMEETEAVDSPDDKAWFLTSIHFSGESGAAYAWNEWERDSLAAAAEDDDEEWQRRIIRHWDQHFSVMFSVKSGYAYFAIRQHDLAIVGGEEPEYEESSKVADSFAQFLQMIRSVDPGLGRWV